MKAALFANIDGFMFLFRWVHVLFGIIWIGHLYYFNFVQGAFFAETDAATKSAAIQKLVPRALWWFRWGAFWTALTGIVLLSYMGSTHQFSLQSPATYTILTGALLGLLMAANVWFVIWPAQKIVIASAVQAAAGKGAIPEAAAAGARALLASRTNVLFSLPMLFFMLASKHLVPIVGENPNFGLLTVAILVIIGALEFNALKGKLGPLATVKGVVHMGVVLTAVLYAAMEILL